MKNSPNLPSKATWSNFLAHRIRVFLHTSPLNDLHKADNVLSPENQHYPSLELVFMIFDLIIENSGFDTIVDKSFILKSLTPILVALDQEAGVSVDHARHVKAIDRIIGWLRNDSNRREMFTSSYLVIDEFGMPDRRVVNFRLLMDKFHETENAHVLHLSNEAINLYMSSLNHDIEDAQAAAEAIVQSQLDRGKYNDAVHSAKNARISSVMFRNKIQDIRKRLQRDLSSVDWEVTGREIDSAVVHIKKRIEMEDFLVNGANSKLNELALDSENFQKVLEVVNIVRECTIGHTELHKVLMQIRNTFLDEQARQGFTTTSDRKCQDIKTGLLEPMMRKATSEALQILDRAFPMLVGPKPSSAFSLLDLVTWQLRSRMETQVGEIEIVEPDLVDTESDILVFTEDMVGRMDSFLRSVSLPTTMSTLLERSEKAGFNEIEVDCLVLLVLKGFDLEDAQNTPVMCRRHTGTLQEGSGYIGDELMIDAPGSTIGEVRG